MRKLLCFIVWSTLRLLRILTSLFIFTRFAKRRGYRVERITRSSQFLICAPFNHRFRCISAFLNRQVQRKHDELQLNANSRILPALPFVYIHHPSGFIFEIAIDDAADSMFNSNDYSACLEYNVFHISACWRHSCIHSSLFLLLHPFLSYSIIPAFSRINLVGKTGMRKK